MTLALALLVAAAPDEVLAHGGELDGPPAQTTVVEGDQVTAFGFTEVPPKSRLQAAYAISDANARAEIVKLVRVQVTDALKAHSTESSEEIETLTREVAKGLLPALPQAEHGWRRLKRGDEVVLQVWSRIALARSQLKKVVAEKIK
jgi:hypothetical protein